MKKIRCPYGSDDATFANAVREVKNYYRFAGLKSPYIIKTIDEAVVSDTTGAKTFYILLPYFERSLQDVLAANMLENTSMGQADVVKIFVGVLRGVQIMHNYKKPAGDVSDSDTAEDGAETDAMLHGDEDGGPFSDMAATEMHEWCPYAHKDIKPANVMISAEGLPVLVDLGSCSKARITVKSRQQALALTDFAQEHCTLPYRAPELLDVATNAEITEATDIWSLGCLLYACCFGFSPFEKLEIEQGANLTVAISQGKYHIPADTTGFSDELIDIIKSCLVLDPTERPSVNELLDRCLSLPSSE
ncbi:hypothetical protein JCM33374_g6516 [Metschnikowia sp. JCM 33374]|nr:hypothetical protein JCM33374_g6516 [Metschnikowia sp. JCM 33374]